jgi:hypothetical protein
MAVNRLDSLSAYLGQVFRQFESGGDFYQTLRENSRPLLFHLGYLFLLNSVLLAIRLALGPAAVPFSLGALDVFEVAALLLSAYPIYRVLSILSMLASKFSDAFYFEPKELGIKEKMAQDAFFASSFFLLSLSIPLAIALLSLPAFLQALSFIPMAVSFIFLWDLALLSTELLKPFGLASSMGRMSPHEFYMKMHKRRRELRAKALREKEDPGRYILAPISLLWKNKKPKENRPKRARKLHRRTHAIAGLFAQPLLGYLPYVQ